MDKPFRRRDLLGIRDLTAEEITGILDTAENFSEISNREVKKVPALRGKTVRLLLALPPALRKSHATSAPGPRDLPAAVNSMIQSKKTVPRGTRSMMGVLHWFENHSTIFQQNQSCRINALTRPFIAGIAHFKWE